MLWWAGASSDFWKPPVLLPLEQQDRLGSMPRGGREWPGRRWVPDVNFTPIRLRHWEQSLGQKEHMRLAPLLTFVSYVPHPCVGGSRARTLQARVVPTAPLGLLAPPSLLLTLWESLGKILPICVLTFWVSVSWGMRGHQCLNNKNKLQWLLLCARHCSKPITYTC